MLSCPSIISFSREKSVCNVLCFQAEERRGPAECADEGGELDERRQGSRQGLSPNDAGARSCKLRTPQKPTYEWEAATLKRSRHLRLMTSLFPKKNKQTNKLPITMFTQTRTKRRFKFSCSVTTFQKCAVPVSESVATPIPHPQDEWIQNVTVYSENRASVYGTLWLPPNDWTSVTEQMQPHTCSPGLGSRKTDDSIHTHADNLSPVTAVSLKTWLTTTQIGRKISRVFSKSRFLLFSRQMWFKINH